eukprot:Gb_35560 [translate_table: standard]
MWRSEETGDEKQEYQVITTGTHISKGRCICTQLPSLLREDSLMSCVIAVGGLIGIYQLALFSYKGSVGIFLWPVDSGQGYMRHLNQLIPSLIDLPVLCRDMLPFYGSLESAFSIGCEGSEGCASSIVEQVQYTYGNQTIQQ